LEECVKPVVQMLALYTIMEMGDHHPGNMSVDATGSPFIIDFFFAPKHFFDVEKDFYKGIKCRYDETLRIK
jgi:hypothetical protein